MLTLSNLRAELRKKANPKKAKFLQRYFRTGKGEYGEGDVFIGLSSVVMRPLAKKYKNLKLAEIQHLLKSKIHEERQTALLILVEQFNQSRGVMIYHNIGQGVVINHHTMLRDSAMTRHSATRKPLNNSIELSYRQKERKKEEERQRIFEFYLRNTKYINNWDLVDLSAPKIVGEYLLNLSRLGLIYKTKRVLYKLVKSKNLWERRIAVLATFAFIRQGQFSESLKSAEMLLKDKKDLIHKAVGWMLREVGKRSQPTLEIFLKKHASKMPRVMLRYAIEKFSSTKRVEYLKSDF